MVSQVRADLHAKAFASTHPGRHSKSPEPVTPSGVRPGQALLDGDPPLVDGPRQRKSTERGQIQADKMHALNERRAQREASQQSQPTASQPTASGRRGRSTDIRPLSQSNANTTNGRRGQSTDIRRFNQSDAHTTMPNSKFKSCKSRSQSQPRHRVRVHETDPKANEEQERRKRESNLKRIARSPTPGSTDVEPDEPSQHTSAQQPAESQYTYIWNDVGYESLVDARGSATMSKAGRKTKFSKNSTKSNTLKAMKTIKRLPWNIRGTILRPLLTRLWQTIVLPPTPITVGGGWHRANEPAPGPVLVPQATASWPAKRSIDTADGAMVKRMRHADPNNTDTESESDEEPTFASTGPHPPPAPPAPPAIRAEPLQPLTATLTRQSTSTTVPETPLEGQSTGSPSLGGPSVSCFPPLPRLMSPLNVPCGPVHARLQTKVAARNCLADLAAVALGEDVEMGERETQEETQEETREETPWQEIRQAQAPPITYAGYRSHIDSPDGIPVPRAPPPTRASSPAPAQHQLKRPRAPSNSVLAHLGRLQMADAVGDMIRAGRAEAMSRSRIRRIEPSAPPKTTTQQLSSTAATSNKSSSRRLEPVAAARTDMVEFNKRCARDNVTSFVQSVTRQNERKGRCALREGEERLRHELLPDNEEDLAHDDALRQGKQPTGGRKKKPLARDFTGIRRQILTLAKVHLFAFALSEGIYQTRATFMMWAALVHEVTWHMELPDVPYVVATTEELEVMVNYLATLRGKMKERVRPIVGPLRGFNHCVATQQDIQDNLDLFHELHPNSFHCTMQFCIEEWSNGYFMSRDLGTANMLDKYEAHLVGLKDLRKVAPKRLQSMQDGWFEYA
ncbi:hypothetical protein FRC06_003774, partial [Ceratobasidium sp. 370]